MTTPAMRRIMALCSAETVVSVNAQREMTAPIAWVNAAKKP